jgi:hypothetical protein
MQGKNEATKRDHNNSHNNKMVMMMMCVRTFLDVLLRVHGRNRSRDSRHAGSDRSRHQNRDQSDILVAKRVADLDDIMDASTNKWWLAGHPKESREEKRKEIVT